MKLPYKFRELAIDIDVNQILEELRGLGEDSWERHGFHQTGHDIISLLSTNGTLYHEDGSVNNSLLPPFLPTSNLDKMPYTKEILHSFGAPPQRTRFAKMKSGQIISPHRDLHPHWHNKVRVHVPIITDKQVNFHIWEENHILDSADRTDAHFSTGKAWVFDTWRVHAVTNFSDIDRIHLIIDCEPRGKLFELMFDDVEHSSMFESLSYEYPSEYTTDFNTLKWLTGGSIETGKKIWNTTVSEKKPADRNV